MTYSFRTNGNFIDFVHTDNTSLQVESVLRSLHNTSRCVTWSLPEDTTRISFVVDDIRVDNFLLTEIDFDGVAIDSQDDFETGITAMFTGLAGGSTGGSSILVYTASLNQASALVDPSTADVYNTIGTITWARSGLGVYTGTSAALFTANKTIIPPFSKGGSSLIGLFNTTPFDFSYSLEVSTTSVIILRVYDITGNSVDLFTAMGALPITVTIMVVP